jgi:hypothetical protein
MPLKKAVLTTAGLDAPGTTTTTTYYTYDQRDQLQTVLQYNSDGGTLNLAITYTYDVFDRLIAESRWTQSTGTVVTHFGYDGANIVFELNSGNALQTRYVRPDGMDALAAQESGGNTVTWALTDYQGSERGVTDATGAVLDKVTYSAFGLITNETSATNGGRFKYTGILLNDRAGLRSGLYG